MDLTADLDDLSEEEIMRLEQQLQHITTVYDHVGQVSCRITCALRCRGMYSGTAIVGIECAAVAGSCSFCSPSFSTTAVDPTSQGVM